MACVLPWQEGVRSRRLLVDVGLSGNWRILFRFADNDAFDVDLADYHPGSLTQMAYDLTRARQREQEIKVARYGRVVARAHNSRPRRGGRRLLSSGPGTRPLAGHLHKTAASTPVRPLTLRNFQ
jgi:hypothetical protein